MVAPHGEHTQALTDVLAQWRKEREALRAEWAEKRDTFLTQTFAGYQQLIEPREED